MNDLSPTKFHTPNDVSKSYLLAPTSQPLGLRPRRSDAALLPKLRDRARLRVAPRSQEHVGVRDLGYRAVLRDVLPASK